MPFNTYMLQERKDSYFDKNYTKKTNLVTQKR